MGDWRRIDFYEEIKGVYKRDYTAIYDATVIPTDEVNRTIKLYGLGESTYNENIIIVTKEQYDKTFKRLVDELIKYKTEKEL